MILDLIQIGASKLLEGVALWQGYTKSSDDDADKEPLDDGDVMQGLGLTSMPYPADDDGFAEGVCARGVGGKDVIWLGARDTRSAAIVGNAKPGDTILHSTGPEQAAQVQCKESQRLVGMFTKSSGGKSMVCALDGSTDQFNLILAGMAMQFNARDGTVTIANGKGATLLMQGDTVTVSKLSVGGTPVSAFASAQKVFIELAKIAAALGSIPTGPTIPYVTPLPVESPGTSAGG